MIRVTGRDNRRLKMQLDDVFKFNTLVEDKLKYMVEGFDIINRASSVTKMELYEMYLKMYVLKALISELVVEENKPYIVNLKIGDGAYNYIVSNLNNDKMGNGLTISETLQN